MTDVIYIEFRKALNKASYHRLIVKLKSVGVPARLCR